MAVGRVAYMSQHVLLQILSQEHKITGLAGVVSVHLGVACSGPKVRSEGHTPSQQCHAKWSTCIIRTSSMHCIGPGGSRAQNHGLPVERDNTNARLP